MLKWTIIVALLQAADLLTTWYGGIGREANPLAVWLWASFGFGALILYKVTVVVAFAWCFRLYESLPLRYRVVLQCWAIVVVVGGTALVVAWNLWGLLCG